MVRSTSAVFIGQPFNLADQEEGSGSAAMQGKESPVGSNTQETHQYVGPYRLEKTLGKGQTGGWCAISLPLLPLPLSPLLLFYVINHRCNRSYDRRWPQECLIKFRIFESIYEILAYTFLSDRKFRGDTFSDWRYRDSGRYKFAAKLLRDWTYFAVIMTQNTCNSQGLSRCLRNLPKREYIFHMFLESA